MSLEFEKFLPIGNETNAKLLNNIWFWIEFGVAYLSF